jgi:hypothetical protein
MKPAKPVRCACGKVVLAKEAACGGFFVGCRRNDWLCWSAPVRKTRHDAIAAWNRTMRVHEIQRAARKYLRDLRAKSRTMVEVGGKSPYGPELTRKKKDYFYAKCKYVSFQEAMDTGEVAMCRLKKSCRVAIAKVKK